MNNEIEGMENFFKLRADSYDNHMKENIENYDLFYLKNLKKTPSESLV